MKRLLTILFPLLPGLILAQAGQKFEYPTLGVTIQTPSDLIAQEGEEAILMYSMTMQQTLFALSVHEYSTIQELRDASKEPYTEDDGTYLALNGELEDITDSAVGGIFKGRAGGAAAEAYILGRINPYGEGISIIAVSVNGTTPTDKLRDYAIKINDGISFTEREVPDAVQEYRDRIVNARLQWRSNYSSPSYTGGVSGYSSSTETIDICGQGYFIFEGSSSLSMSSGNLSVLGNSNSSSQGHGTWEVTSDAAGNPLLVLNYYNGSVENYTLYYEGGYMHMNDYKYTIGRGSEYGPACY